MKKALKLALEALETERDIYRENDEDGAPEYILDAIDALEVLAQPEQEPVAWMFQHDETGRMNYVSNDGIHDPTMFLGMNPRYALVCPLYTTPPKRTWVGLSDEERQEIALEVPIDAVLITEAVLKDKNS